MYEQYMRMTSTAVTAQVFCTVLRRRFEDLKHCSKAQGCNRLAR